jgi:hypothetical protein
LPHLPGGMSAFRASGIWILALMRWGQKAGQVFPREAMPICGADALPYIPD